MLLGGHKPLVSMHGLAINLPLFQTLTFQFVWPHCASGIGIYTNYIALLKCGMRKFLLWFKGNEPD